MPDNTPKFELEPRHPKGCAPVVIFRRNTAWYAPVVFPEDHAFELYLLLKAHFEGDDQDEPQL